METFKQLLTELKACDNSIEWAGDMPIEEIVLKCHRGDWLLWLAIRVDIDKRKLILAKGHCGNTVSHLMKDERSIKAVDAAIAYGEGNITEKELLDFETTANVAVDTAASPVAYTAAHAAYTSVVVDGNAAAAAANVTVDTAALRKNRMQTADICREIIGDLIIERVNNLLKDNK